MYTEYWLNVCKDIGEKVFAEIKKQIGNEESRKVMGMGSGGDKTLIIDDLAEKVVLDELKKTGKSFKIISEEFGEKIIGTKPEVTIIVDPIDGSNNVRFGIPFNSLSIAIGDLSGKIKGIEIGYVKDFVRGSSYYAIKGKGAYKNDKRIHASKEEIGCLLIDVVLEREKNFKRIGDVGKNFPFVRMLGSACLAMCFVARGSVDGYVGLSAKRTLDYTATQLIIKEADGIVKDINGKDFSEYDIGFNIDVNIVAASNDNMFKKIKSVLK
jgi:myo-inositol-1(or 4)-monophosphatase